MADDERHDGPDSAEPEEAEEASRKVPEEVSGEGATPLGGTGEHSEAPGPHGTGEIYPRGARPEKDNEAG